MKIHVFGSCEKKLDYIGESNSLLPSCVCVRGGGGRGPSGEAFFTCFFIPESYNSFSQPESQDILCGDEGEGTEAFFVYFSDVF